MANNPKISVLLPVYNAEQYVRQTISSILASSFNDFELVIVLDGCTDSSSQLCRSFELDSRVRIIERTLNKGLVSTLNEGLVHCKGEFIARIDADDLMDKNRLALQLDYMNKNKLDLCGTNCVMIGPTSHIIKTKIYPSKHKSCLAYMLHSVPFGHGSVMLRKAFIQHNQLLYRDVPCEDFNLWVEAALKGGKFGNLPNFCFSRRVIENSYSSTKRVSMKRHTQVLCATVREQTNWNVNVDYWLDQEMSEDEVSILIKILFKTIPNKPLLSINLLKKCIEKIGRKKFARCFLKSL